MFRARVVIDVIEFRNCKRWNRVRDGKKLISELTDSLYKVYR